MRRIAVLGNGGAGKTTLAAELADALGLPVIHGDSLRGDWEQVHGALIAHDEWVIDAMRIGTLDARLARADTAVFLDLPLLTCVLGIARRGDLALLLRTPGFWRWVLRFQLVDRPRILAMLDAHSATTDVVVLRSRRDVDRFVARETVSDTAGVRHPRQFFLRGRFAWTKA